MRGSCHCGAVTISADHSPAELGECNCSICRRTGGLWAYYRVGEARAEGETLGYEWGDLCLSLRLCPVCGCHTHSQALAAVPDRIALNARLFDGFDAESVPRRKIDGASF